MNGKVVFLPYTQKDWFVATSDRGVLAGPFRTRREARHKAFQLARSDGDADPWGTLTLLDRDYPSFYTLHTELEVYFIGLGGALYEQGIAVPVP